MTNIRGPGTKGKGAATRQQLLHATVELMAELGIDRVRTRSIAERAGVNPALVHYHFGSVSALVLEAAQDALLRTLGPSLEAFQSGATLGDSIHAILVWLDRYGRATPGSTILAEAMVKATRNRAFRKWAAEASRRFRSIIEERLRVAQQAGELDPRQNLGATVVVLAAALDGLLFHRLVDPRLDVMQAAVPLEALVTGAWRGKARRS